MIENNEIEVKVEAGKILLTPEMEEELSNNKGE